MLTTRRTPVTVDETLLEEFMQPLGLTQGALAFLDLDRQRTITAAHADRPEPADFLQLEGWMARILLE